MKVRATGQFFAAGRLLAVIAMLTAATTGCDLHGAVQQKEYGDVTGLPLTLPATYTGTGTYIHTFSDKKSCTESGQAGIDIDKSGKLKLWVHIPGTIVLETGGVCSMLTDGAVEGNAQASGVVDLLYFKFQTCNDGSGEADGDGEFNGNGPGNPVDSLSSSIHAKVECFSKGDKSLLDTYEVDVARK